MLVISKAMPHQNLLYIWVKKGPFVRQFMIYQKGLDMYFRDENLYFSLYSFIKISWGCSQAQEILKFLVGSLWWSGSRLSIWEFSFKYTLVTVWYPHEDNFLKTTQLEFIKLIIWMSLPRQWYCLIREHEQEFDHTCTQCLKVW